MINGDPGLRVEQIIYDRRLDNLRQEDVLSDRARFIAEQHFNVRVENIGRGHVLRITGA